MYEHTKEYDCHYQEREPYEVLYTKWLPYDDVLKLKDVEEMVEVYYNSGQFVHTLPMIERLYENPFDFFQELGDFYRAKGYSEAAHNRIQRYEILLEFLRDEKRAGRSILPPDDGTRSVCAGKYEDAAVQRIRRNGKTNRVIFTRRKPKRERFCHRIRHTIGSSCSA